MGNKLFGLLCSWSKCRCPTPNPPSSESENYYVWYRHTGEDLPSGNWFAHKFNSRDGTAQEILEDVGEYYITHMCILGRMPPSLNYIAPKLTHFKSFSLEDNSQLESLRELKELKALVLEANDFSNGLPSVIGELISLTELRMNNCGLKDLPENLGKLKKLEVLNLQLNNFSSGLPDVVGELTSLRELHVEDCSLTDLPENLRELKNLEVLNLQLNNFSSGLPDVVGELTSLRELHVEHCWLTDLPKNMSELKQLKVLELGGNDFSCGCPDVIPQLTSLTKLSLNQCVVTRFPPRLEELRQLEVLHLGDNYLSSGIPDVIAELDSLTKLDLQNCSLTDLPQRFGELRQLECLLLGGNHFSNGLPDVIVELRSLTELHLQECSFTDLPQSLEHLRQLHRLDLANNKFKEIPSAIYKLKELEWLNLSDNVGLEEMDNRILQLKNLQDVVLQGTSLQPVLSTVQRQGIGVIKRYFTDLAQAVVSTIPVAIIGEAFAGKTCIAKSLIGQKREISDRSSPLENTTKVFEIGTLNLGTSEINLIDFGGQHIYHVAYQLALKETCVPLLVVDIARYKTLIEEIGSAEATKRLCMEWLCHLYVAQPTLGRPMLALTHIDELSSRDEFEELKGTLLQRAEDIQLKWMKGEERFLSTGKKNDSGTERISCIKMLKFRAEDIFEFTDKDESSDIKALTARIKSRCVGEIPQNWNDVSNFLKTLKKPYIEISDVTARFPACREILQYLQTTGTVLWFDQKEELKKYVFHRTQPVTNMVALLFPLEKEKMKAECIDSFSRFVHNKQPIGIAAYKQFLGNYLYNTTGMIDEALLCNLVETQTEFEFPIAVELLKCFRIIHGPMQLKDDFLSRTVYLVPSFIEKSMDKSWETSGRLQLRFDLIFNGLPLPEHVYQLMTVAALNLKKKYELVDAYSNGAKVQHDEHCSTYLVHDYYERKVTVQVSTNVGSLKDSWDNLKRTTEALKSLIKKEWPACCVELQTYCAHCLFLKDSAPGSLPNPTWYTESETFPGLKLVKCLKSGAESVTVPRSFLMPCANLNTQEIAELEGCLTKWQPDAFDAGVRKEVQ